MSVIVLVREVASSAAGATGAVRGVNASSGVNKLSLPLWSMADTAAYTRWFSVSPRSVSTGVVRVRI